MNHDIDLNAESSEFETVLRIIGLYMESVEAGPHTRPAFYRLAVDVLKEFVAAEQP